MYSHCQPYPNVKIDHVGEPIPSAYSVDSGARPDLIIRTDCLRTPIFSLTDPKAVFPGSLFRLVKSFLSNAIDQNWNRHVFLLPQRHKTWHKFMNNCKIWYHQKLHNESPTNDPKVMEICDVSDKNIEITFFKSSETNKRKITTWNRKLTCG